MLMNGVQKGQVYKCREAEKHGFVRKITIVVRSANPDRWWVDSYNSVTKQTRRITIREDRLLSADYEKVEEAQQRGQLELELGKLDSEPQWTLLCASNNPKTYMASVGGGPTITADTPEAALRGAIAKKDETPTNQTREEQPA